MVNGKFTDKEIVSNILNGLKGDFEPNNRDALAKEIADAIMEDPRLRERILKKITEDKILLDMVVKELESV